MLLDATDALARYDQALRGMHNSAILLAPLRNQEAVLSSRMEGTISTMDEIMQMEAEYGEQAGEQARDNRHDAIETILYQRTLRTAQQEISLGRPLTASLLKSMHQQLLSRILLDAGLLQTVREATGRTPGIYRFEPLMQLVRV